jgi:hypothetical protein
MLSAETIQSMGRKNVSVNSELTMERTREVLKTAKNKQKNEIDSLTGLKRVSLNRTYVTGVITAKVAIAIAQILDVNPFYLTGDIDERGKYNKDILDSFLITKGYPNLAGMSKKAERQAEAPPAAEKADKACLAHTEPLLSSAFSNSLELAAAASQLTKEEALELLGALYIRAKAGGNAAQVFEIVKRCLLT